MPDLVARACVDSPHVVRDGEVQNAIDQQGRRLDGHRAVGLKQPREREISYVLRSDLMERAVPPARVVAVIAGPTVGRRMQERLVIYALCQSQGRRGESERCGQDQKKRV